MATYNAPPTITTHGITRIEAGPVIHREATSEHREYQTRDLLFYGQDNQVLFSLCLFAHTDFASDPLTVKEVPCLE